MGGRWWRGWASAPGSTTTSSDPPPPPPPPPGPVAPSGAAAPGGGGGEARARGPMTEGDVEAQYLYELGSALHEAGDPAAAAREYAAAAALRPGEYRYQNRFAFALAQVRAGGFDQYGEVASRHSWPIRLDQYG